MTENHSVAGQGSANPLKTIQDVFSLFVGIGVLLSISGFVVVNSYLEMYTKVSFVSQIDPVIYLVAGIPVFLAAVLISGFIGLVVASLPIGKVRGGSITRLPKYMYLSVFRYFYQNWLYYLATALMVFPISYFYGTNLYATLPYYFGGGGTDDIKIIFDSPESLKTYGFQPEQSQSNYTQPMRLLLHLTNGILVCDYNVNPARTIAVDNSVIKGILGNTPPSSILGAATTTPLVVVPIIPGATPEVTPDLNPTSP